ncbi:MAG: SelT/SelW/SelH family protein [Dehalococcoidia bacterium]|nr:SelT/SelW/SelH family protein [Dehalococcoidia bacterium]
MADNGKRYVTIEYCTMCMDLPAALKLADDILKDYQWDLDGVTLQPGGKAVFEVYLNEDKVFSKIELDRYPTYDEIKAVLIERVGPPADILS